MARREIKKRMGKKHRQAATRPRKGKNPRSSYKKLQGGASPKGRKSAPAVAKPKTGALKRIASTLKRPESVPDASPARDLRDEWRDEELLAPEIPAEKFLLDQHSPLIAICGRPNVGKSTLFNRLTGTRRSIVGDEPGITRDRIYGEVEWQGRTARLVDTGGIVPDDEALIPAAIFRQAQIALSEADAIIMVVDGRTELAAPDLELARLLLRGGKNIFLAVNKMDTEAMNVQAEAFRRLGFRNVLPISAEHASGIGDLLDAVFAVLPEKEPPDLSFRSNEVAEESASSTSGYAPGVRPRRTHGSFEQHETRVAIIGRPNVGKSTLLNMLTGTGRAIVSPIAGTTRDAVDEVVERKGHD